ncbi:hypothetical protein LX36DRAFT_664855 [Colletotrichum falcatum]|nr:hypothetical protein LX36DRAFT_664855 [Colletotrichum falcatum]
MAITDGVDSARLSQPTLAAVHCLFSSWSSVLPEVHRIFSSLFTFLSLLIPPVLSSAPCWTTTPRLTRG